MFSTPDERGSARPIRARRSVAWVLALVLAVMLGAGTSPAHAQNFDERIASYEIEAEILADGDMVVAESILYDFGGLRRRGIFRDIPTRADYDDETWRITNIDNIEVSVTDGDGSPAPGGADDIDVGFEDNNFRIRIGNESVFLDGGTYRYNIQYLIRDTVEAVDRNGERWEEIAWNAVGTGWEVPIDEVSVKVTSPTTPTRFTCFIGARGAVDPCKATAGGETSVLFTSQGLLFREGMTVAVALKPGSVSDTELNLKPKWSLSRAFSVTGLSLAGFALVSVTGFGAVLALLARHGRDQRTAVGAYLPFEHGGHHGGTGPVDEAAPLVSPLEKPTGPVRFRPPDNSTPGLVGVIIDESADPLDVSATIVDLAVRGYLRIEEQGKMGRGGDFLLRRLPEPAGELLDYERYLLDELWRHLPTDGENAAVALGELNQNFAASMSGVQSRLYSETMQRGWFTRHPELVRKAWLAAGIFALVVAVGITIALAAVSTWAIIGLPLILAATLLLALHRRMPSRTANGRAVLEQAVGYEKFLDVADADQLRFQELQNDFVAALPYAMVFGLTERWAEVLSVLQDGGFDAVPTWYVGNWGPGFHYYHLAYSLDSFTSRAHSTLTAPAPVETSSGGGFSGGSFGGGFSGGGFGGGGGGSW